MSPTRVQLESDLAVIRLTQHENYYPNGSGMIFIKACQIESVATVGNTTLIQSCSGGEYRVIESVDYVLEAMWNTRNARVRLPPARSFDLSAP